MCRYELSEEFLCTKDGQNFLLERCGVTKFVKKPIKYVVDIHNLYEHQPLDIYKYGEYPRFITPVGHNEPLIEIVKIKELS